MCKIKINRLISIFFLCITCNFFSNVIKSIYKNSQNEKKNKKVKNKIFKKGKKSHNSLSTKKKYFYVFRKISWVKNQLFPTLFKMIIPKTIDQCWLSNIRHTNNQQLIVCILLKIAPYSIFCTISELNLRVLLTNSRLNLSWVSICLIRLGNIFLVSLSLESFSTVKKHG